MKTIKTKKIKLSVLSFLFCLSINAQQTRVLETFTGIRVGDELDITIVQGDTTALTINAPNELLAQIQTSVTDNVLSVFTEGSIKNEKEITIIITVKSLTSIKSLGAADIKSSNQLICDKLLIELNGAGDVILDVKSPEIKAVIYGSGDMELKGSTQQLDAIVSGTGDINAIGLEANKVTASVSGTGDAKVFAVQSITANVSGTGSIIYKGTPTDRNVNISGVGTVRESRSGTGEETASDTTKIKLGNKKYMIIGEDNKAADEDAHGLSPNKNNFKHWSGLEVGINGYLNAKNSINDMPNFLELNYAKSLQFGLNIFEKNFHIYKNYINVVTGIGFDFNHYAFENNFTLKANTPFLSGEKDSTIDYKKNTLNISYLKAPLLLEINTSKNPKHHVHIALGMEFAYRIHSVTKQKYVQNGKTKKVKTKDDYNIEPFRFSAVARVGYNNVTVFANYALNRLFKQKQGPEVYPFTIGITFTI